MIRWKAGREGARINEEEGRADKGVLSKKPFVNSPVSKDESMEGGAEVARGLLVTSLHFAALP